MEGLTLTRGQQRRIFKPTHEVVVIEGGAPVVHGQWQSVPAPENGPRVNQISYTFDGQDAAPIAVRWSFNGDNQLVGVIPAAANEGADSAAFTFPGMIKVDDKNDIAYELIDDTGALTGNEVVVLGGLSFD